MKKISIRALILDYGGVISLPQNPENVTNILRLMDRDYQSFYSAYLRQRAQYDRAQISGDQYWRDLLLQCGLDPVDFDTAHLIQEDVVSWTQINPAVIQFITEKRSQIGKLAMISNMTVDTLAYMRVHFGWLGLFDDLCFSCDLGFSKPDREIYETCLRRLRLSPQECLFVDDSARNVQGAAESGLHAIHFTGFDAFLQEVSEKYCFTP